MKNLTLAVLLFASTAVSWAQTDALPFVHGTYRKVHSTVLGEDRTLLVRLPADYDRTDKRYPVLFRLDGSVDFFVHTASAVEYLVDMRDAAIDPIIVAIENTDRNRDMDPERGAESFVRFITGELIPYVEKNYRTNGFRILAGQSFSSLFSVYLILKEPASFDAYILGSFGLYKPSLLPLFESELAKSSALKKATKKYVFIANASSDAYDEDGSRTKRGAQFLDEVLRSAPGAVALKVITYDGEGHVPFPFVYDGLKWLYSQEEVRTRLLR